MLTDSILDIWFQFNGKGNGKDIANGNGNGKVNGNNYVIDL